MAVRSSGRRVLTWLVAPFPKPRELAGYVRSLDALSAGIWLVAGAAAAIRWHGLTAESLWLDEVVSYVNVAVRFDGPVELLLTEPTIEPHPPLYYLLLDGWTALFGTSTVGLRSMSLVLGVFTVVLTYLLTVKLFENRMTGLLAASLVAVSSMHVYFAQETRMYTLLTALTLLSYYWYVDVVFADDPGRPAVARYVLATVLLGYTHTFAMFVVLAQHVAVFLLALRRSAGGGADSDNRTGAGGRAHAVRWKRLAGSPLVRRWVGIQTVVALLLAPWLVLLAAHVLGIPIVDQGDTSWIPAEPLWYLFATYGEYLFYSLGDLPVFGMGWLVYLAGLLALVALVRFDHDVVAGDAEGDELQFSPSDRAVVLAAWAVVPTIVPFLLSHLLQPIYRHKYTIAASLALFVMVGRGVGKLRDAYGPVLPYGLAAVLLVGVAAGLPPTYERTQKPDWRGAVDYVDDRAADDAVVVTTPRYVADTVRYYARPDATVRGLAPGATWAGNVSAATGGADTVWLVVGVWHVGESDVQSLVAELKHGGYVRDSASARYFRPGVSVVAFDNFGTPLDAADPEGNESASDGGEPRLEPA